ncbi:TPA: hypothetical protein VDA20_001646 [Streptococcus pyogenes]|uniref:Phage protein n=1 Tax=Streptococcus pyogenes TaxID=1314 RepID=A0A5S4TGY7_STRPY|nr:hypothetical protein [Streptococcus pyogenes]HER4545105.1 hypothetical protein [Streptococcus pyogenes NGAS675]HER4548390.1 hypothetical protein [Streptococcus pyogenes NGAS670]HER4636455.1 hypothetical protein [Streptococcus pyogenes NGAS510]HER4668748.1 hypothetical protein [Streptococcus pyogenes NGAS401]HER4685349.1 hypothetical protein [Streptococcus pyogenes NGAS353]HER4687539.1 hypothetical protein [Streptococcus pyogenes NGAS364]HER4760191.1 hypothetical protein [Streptococcus pyo
MDQEIFNGFNILLKKMYGKQASIETFNQFIEYCQRGKEVNGVRPVLNPVNLYAFGLSITTLEAMKIYRER